MRMKSVFKLYNMDNYFSDEFLGFLISHWFIYLFVAHTNICWHGW
jgi:hypothetical protein